MTRIIIIFLLIVFLSIGAFAVVFFRTPSEERQETLSTQGIRLVGSAIIYTGGTNERPTSIKVGALVLGNNIVYRVNELRQTRDGDTAVSVSWKYITRFNSYQTYSATPYNNAATYQLNQFLLDKKIIEESEIRKFYNTVDKVAINAVDKDATSAAMSDTPSMGGDAIVLALPETHSSTRVDAVVAPPIEEQTASITETAPIIEAINAETAPELEAQTY